ncbi:MAG: hypothetical protein HWE16_01320 [Gammaproteobacteria bacterium]|nr:hypothetical protein [Gammaproteobacteria bacterium]
MKKKIAILSSLLWVSSAVMAQEQKPAAELGLFDQFEQLSQSALSQDSPMVFIEREVGASLANANLTNNGLLSDSTGQWSVSFDLNRLVSTDHQFDFNSQFNPVGQPNYDWELGTSLVSPDQTSRFYVNYGNRKVPISISFDDVATQFPGLQEEALNLGFEQKLNESWAVSIAYLKSDSDFDAVINNGLSGAASQHQLNYLFDFDANNKLETVNFSPFNQDITQAGFLDDISAIQIKVSRQMTDSLVLSASAAQGQSELTSFGLNQQNLSMLSDANSLKSERLALEGQYQLNERWSLDANLEHQVDHVSKLNSTRLNDFSQLDATTLDIGVQYQSNWDQVGVVIRIDLMNLLGVSQTQAGQMGLDQSGLKPFSFDSPKYIKVSGSINF